MLGSLGPVALQQRTHLAQPAPPPAAVIETSPSVGESEQGWPAPAGAGACAHGMSTAVGCARDMLTGDVTKYVCTHHVETRQMSPSPTPGILT